MFWLLNGLGSIRMDVWFGGLAWWLGAWVGDVVGVLVGGERWLCVDRQATKCGG